MSPRRYGFEQVVHQKDVHHGGFIDDDGVGFQGILFIPLKTPSLGEYSSSR